jgi:hypothetical protein
LSQGRSNHGWNIPFKQVSSGYQKYFLFGRNLYFAIFFLHF